VNLSQALKLVADRSTANREGDELLQGLQAIDAICGALANPDPASLRIQAQAAQTVRAMLEADEQQLQWENLLTTGGDTQ
jgi:hypothetical protein